MSVVFAMLTPDVGEWTELRASAWRLGISPSTRCQRPCLPSPFIVSTPARDMEGSIGSCDRVLRAMEGVNNGWIHWRRSTSTPGSHRSQSASGDIAYSPPLYEGRREVQNLPPHSAPMLSRPLEFNVPSSGTHYGLRWCGGTGSWETQHVH